jgi:hypothetical protein
MRVAVGTYPTARELTEALGGKWNTFLLKGKACCPAHEDQEPSLDIVGTSSGKVLFTCRAGCDQDAVVAALRRRGVWPERSERPAKAPKAGGKLKVVATYSYQLACFIRHNCDLAALRQWA